MMKAAVLESEEYANDIRGKEYSPDCFCHPVLDGLGRWVIFVHEMEGLRMELELVDWIEPKVELELPNLSALNNENE